jgi:dTDP-4-amino-4,6-dideoxygalactose transaminase
MRTPSNAAFAIATDPLPANDETRATWLPFAEASVGEREIEAVVECLRSGWLTSGPRVLEFEKAFAEYVGAQHAVAVNSCTAALHVALEAVGVGPGDEVITTPMTFAATAAVIEHLGAKPVLGDVDPETWNLDPAGLEDLVTERTKAILPVHFAGQAADMKPILELARRHGLAVVEDAAHALPTRYGGKRVGSIGDVTCFSFYATKTITTGEGGMAVTDDPKLAERMRLMRLHGMSRDAWKRYTKEGSWKYEILAPGYKDNLTDLAAALGLVQLERCDAFHARRREIARDYTAAFSDLDAIRTPRVREPRDHAWHLYVLEVVPEKLGMNRDAFVERLTDANIGSSVHFIPVHVHPYYRERYGYRPDDFPNAHAAYQNVVSLPIYPKMDDDDVADVIRAVRAIVEGGRS